MGKGKNIYAPKFCEAVVLKAEEYEANWEEYDEIPQIVAMAIHCGVSEQSAHAWRKFDDNDKNKSLKERWAMACLMVMAKQQRELVNKGLAKTFDPSLAKLLLKKHGFDDQQKVDYTITQPRIVIGSKPSDE